MPAQATGCDTDLRRFRSLPWPHTG